jgi:hypothetical protein
MQLDSRRPCCLSEHLVSGNERSVYVGQQKTNLLMLVHDGCSDGLCVCEVPASIYDLVSWENMEANSYLSTLSMPIQSGRCHAPHARNGCPCVSSGIAARSGRTPQFIRLLVPQVDRFAGADRKQGRLIIGSRSEPVRSEVSTGVAAASAAVSHIELSAPARLGTHRIQSVAFTISDGCEA